MSKHRIPFSLAFQQVIAFLFFPLLYCLLWFWMSKIQAYSIDDIKGVRRRYRELMRKNRQPVLICPNHLTFIDSLLIAWALASPWYYLCHFKCFPWNLPKRSHVARSKLYQGICYVGKCLLIDSDTTKAKATMSKAQSLLQKGHHVMVFPEGTRSKTGRVNTENFVYGVGGLINQIADMQVLMVYLRGNSQKKRSKMPRKGDKFSLTMNLFRPSSAQKGLRAQREISQQLIQKLHQMEEAYFASDSGQ